MGGGALRAWRPLLHHQPGVRSVIYAVKERSFHRTLLNPQGCCSPARRPAGAAATTMMELTRTCLRQHFSPPRLSFFTPPLSPAVRQPTPRDIRRERGGGGGESRRGGEGERDRERRMEREALLPRAMSRGREGRGGDLRDVLNLTDTFRGGNIKLH